MRIVEIGLGIREKGERGSVGDGFENLGGVAQLTEEASNVDPFSIYL